MGKWVCTIEHWEISGPNPYNDGQKDNQGLVAINASTVLVGGYVESRPTRIGESACAMKLQAGECGLRSISARFDVSTLSTSQRRRVGYRGKSANYLDQMNKMCTPRLRRRSGCPILLSHSMHDRSRARYLSGQRNEGSGNLSRAEEAKAPWRLGEHRRTGQTRQAPIGKISRKKMPGSYPHEKGVKAPPRDRSKKLISLGSFHRTVLM